MSENLYFAKRPGTRKVTQLFANGDFKMGTHGWTGSGGQLVITTRNALLYINTTDEWPGLHYYSESYPIEYTAGHIYYIRFRCKSDLDKVYMNNGNGVNDLVGSGMSMSRYKLAGIIKEANDSSPYHQLQIFAIGPARYKQINVEYIEVLDLTADFGAGNEPTTAAECEAYYGPDYHPYGESYLDDWYAAYANICKNLFNPAHLLKADGWTMEDLSHYKGSIATLYNLYGESGYPFEKPWKPNTRYAFQCHIKVDVNDRSNNVRVVFIYTDGSSNSTVYVNSGDDRDISVVSAAGKTVSLLRFDYNSYCTIHLSNIQVEEGDTITNPEPYRPSPIYKRVTQVYPVWDEDYWADWEDKPGLHIHCDEATGIYTTNGQIKNQNMYYHDLRLDWGANTLIDGHTYYLRMNSTCTQVIDGWLYMMELSVASPNDGVNCAKAGQSKKIWTFHRGSGDNYVILRTQGPKNIGGPAFIHNNEKTRIEIFDLTIDFGPGNEPTTIEECEQYYGPDYVPFGSHEILCAYAFRKE